jgi:ethanolamine ammonia-lyase large subunit
MLGYLTTSFREHHRLRRQAGRGMTTAMQRRLEALGVFRDGVPAAGPEAVARLSAIYARAGGDHRSLAALEEEGRRRLFELQERGFDLGGTDAPRAEARVDAIYANARTALYAAIDASVLRDATPGAHIVRTHAASRDEYLASPPSGEQLRADDARALATLYTSRRPQVQLVVSDGLNANAVNEQLRTFLPGLRRSLAGHGLHVGESDVVVRNGRVRAGYEVGQQVGADVVVHLIGERPGTGLNTLSAYVTYGRDEAGAQRWSRTLPHSATTAVCGIHPRGKPPEHAIAELTRTVGAIVTQRRSGVALGSGRRQPR